MRVARALPWQSLNREYALLAAWKAEIATAQGNALGKDKKNMAAWRAAIRASYNEFIKNE